MIEKPPSLSPVDLLSLLDSEKHRKDGKRRRKESKEGEQGFAVFIR